MALSVEEVIQKSGLSLYQIKVGLIAGLIIASDSASTVLLRILDSILLCEWRLSELEQFRLFNAAYFGMALGAPLFGLLADLCGRKAILQVNLLLSIYLSMVSSASQSYSFALCLRAFIGVSLSGCIVPLFTLYAEFLPTNSRGILLMSVFVFESIGVILQVFLTVIVLPYVGWRWLVAMSTIPLFLVLLFTVFLSESPRYLALQPNISKRLKELRDIIQTIRGQNFMREEPLTSHDLPEPPNIRRPSARSFKVRLTVVRKWRDVRYVFQGGLQKTSLLLTGLWFMAGLTYFGSEILSIEINMVRHHCLQNLYQISLLPIANDDRSCCSTMNATLYQSLALAGLGALGSIPIGVVIVHAFGRTKALTTSALFLGLFYLSLGFCLPTFISTLLFLTVRGFSYTMYATLFVYTVELYPTWCRSTALGIGTGVARMGALVTYGIAVMFLHRISVLGTFGLYSLICAMMVIFSLFLRLETRNECLAETFSEVVNSRRMKTITKEMKDLPRRHRMRNAPSTETLSSTTTDLENSRHGGRQRCDSDSKDMNLQKIETPSHSKGLGENESILDGPNDSSNYQTFQRRRNSS